VWLGLKLKYLLILNGWCMLCFVCNICIIYNLCSFKQFFIKFVFRVLTVCWFNTCPVENSLESTVIKPGPARQVYPGPGGWIGPGLLKDWPMQQPGKTRLTRRVDPWPGRPGRDLIFFSKMVFLLYPFFSYFSSWLITFFKVHYINIRKISYFFNVGFETL